MHTRKIPALMKITLTRDSSTSLTNRLTCLRLNEYLRLLKAHENLKCCDILQPIQERNFIVAFTNSTKHFIINLHIYMAEPKKEF